MVLLLEYNIFVLFPPLVWIVFVLMTFMNVYYYALQPIDDAQLVGGAGAALLWSKFYLDVE